MEREKERKEERIRNNSKKQYLYPSLLKMWDLTNFKACSQWLKSPGSGSLDSPVVHLTSSEHCLGQSPLTLTIPVAQDPVTFSQH